MASIALSQKNSSRRRPRAPLSAVTAIKFLSYFFVIAFIWFNLLYLPNEISNIPSNDIRTIVDHSRTRKPTSKDKVLSIRKGKHGEEPRSDYKEKPNEKHIAEPKLEYKDKLEKKKTKHQEHKDASRQELDDFSRIYEQARESLETCQNSSKEVLQPFGFLNAMDEYNQHHAKQKQQPRLRATHYQPTASTPLQCTHPDPHTKACNVSSFSVLVTFEGLDVRTLFQNILIWLTYGDETAEIVVIMPQKDWEHDDNAHNHTKKHTKYKSRLKDWQENPNHMVSFMLYEEGPRSKVKRSNGTSIWDRLAQFEPKSDAVLWMDGNFVWNFNRWGILSGFELWKRHSGSLVASKVKHNNRFYAVQDYYCRNDESRRRRLGESVESEHDEFKAIEMVSEEHGVLYKPFCGMHQNNVASGNLLGLTGLFVHKSYLCFLQHPVVQPLHEMTVSMAEVRAAISVTLLHTSASELMLFPPRVQLGNESYSGWHRKRAVGPLALKKRGKVDDIKKVLSYFGNAPARVSTESWCLLPIDTPNGNTFNATLSVRKQNTTILIHQIPWMDIEGRGSLVC